MNGEATSLAQDVVATALRRHRGKLEAFVRARVPTPEVEEVLQAAAVRALERRATVREPERLLAWLYTIHRNVITDAVRKAGSRRRLTAHARAEPGRDAIQWPSPLLDEQCRCSVTQARGLGERYASILSLVDLGDHSVAEASKVLGISANNGAVRLHRARKALRKRMLEHCGVSSARECAQCRCIDEGCCA